MKKRPPTGDGWRLAGVILLFLGSSWIGLLCLGAFLSNQKKEPDKKDNPLVVGMMILGTGAIPLVPGLLFFSIGHRRRRFATRLDTIAGQTKTYRRVSLGDLAATLALPLSEVEKIITQGIADDFLEGRIDRQRGIFIHPTGENLPQEIPIPQCPYCHSNISKTFAEGELLRCPACTASL